MKKSPRWKWSKRFVVLLTLYTIVGFFVVPAVIKSQLLKQLPALTHRSATVEEIKFNPFALSFGIKGLSLKETNGDVFTSFDDLYVNFQPVSSILNLAWTFDDIHLEKPFSQIIRQQDGSLNFANLISTNSSARTNSSTQTKSGLPSVIIHSLSISNGTVTFVDLAQLTPFKTAITPINLSFTNLSTIRDRSSASIFQASMDPSETIAWNGNLVLNPPTSDGTFELRGLGLSKYSTYTHQLAGIDISNGVFNLRVDYRFISSSNGMELAVQNLSTSLTNLDVSTTDGRGRISMGSYASKAVIDFKTSITNEKPFLSVTNTWLSLGDLKVQTPVGGETVFAITSFSTTNLQLNLPAREARIGLVQMSGGSIAARQNKDGTINLLALLPPKSTNQTETVAKSSTTETSSPFKAVIDEIVIDDFAIKAEDNKPELPAKLSLDKIHVDLKGVSTVSNTPVDFAVNLRFQETGTIDLKGKTILQPLSADVQIGLTNLDLRALQPYVAEQIKLAITDGSLNLDGHAAYAPNSSGPAITFNGNLSVNKLVTTDDVMFKDFAKWDSLNVNGIAVELTPDKIHVDEVKFAGLNTSFIIGTNGKANLEHILRKQIHSNTNTPVATPVETAKTATPKVLPEVTLGAFVLENASLHFGDQSIEPNCAFDVQEFGGQITGLSSAEDSTAVVDFKGKVDARSPFTVTGKVNPLSRDLFVDVAVGFTNTDLSAFTPYTQKFVGRPLNKGKLSFAVHYSVSKKALKASNGFYIDQLTFGAKNESKFATTLPVKLAVALLKDRQGRIQLDVPVEGRLDDPKFSVGPIIWEVIGNLITKAALSPFSLLGSVFGGGPELSYVNFNPGESSIPDSETNKLNSLVKALYERPELTIELNGSLDPAKNRIPLAKEKLTQILKSAWIKEQTAAGKPPVAIEQVRLEPAEYSRLLNKYYAATIHSTNLVKQSNAGTNVSQLKIGVVKTPLKNVPTNVLQTLAVKPKFKPVNTGKPTQIQPVISDALVPDMQSKLAETISVDENDLRDLMKKRALSVQDYFLSSGKVTPERIFITAPKPMNADSKGEDKVNLTLD